ncbi:hypothetical protein N0V88_001540 [Collariella sp. IMI 366227]|nr:hypothetical protein N0V88_001540 [Collariella sp. IMI 366227]
MTPLRARPLITSTPITGGRKKYKIASAGDELSGVPSICGQKAVPGIWDKLTVDESRIHRNNKAVPTGTYACIGVTSKVGPNGITTPLPIRTGMVSNCKKFVKVKPGDTCNMVGFFNGPISTEIFVL